VERTRCRDALFIEEVNQRVPEADRAEVLSYLRARDRSGEIDEAVARYVEQKVSDAGEKTPHLRTVELALLQVAKRFAGKRVAKIHAPDSAEWVADRSEGLSGKRKKNLRAVLVAFWRWARFRVFRVRTRSRLPRGWLGCAWRREKSAWRRRRKLNAVKQEWRT
jgi:hypothetical protein